MRLTSGKISTSIFAVVSTFCVVLSAAPIKAQETALLTHWSVVVKIRPRPAGSGQATIMLIDGSGTTITTFSGVVLPYSGLAIGVKGPRRDIHDGDTPFGVYKLAGTAGGTPEYQLQPGFGTGKLYLDDYDMYGEVFDANRKLIRLHGGGSGLANPYALNQPLLPTRGCVRMKNRDVNDLIQRLKGLAAPNSVQFIFMGDAAYLNALATNTALSDRSWWPVLRVALQIPSTPTNARVNTSRSPLMRRAHFSIPISEIEAQQSSDSLIEMVNLFAEDIGPKGKEALNALRPQTAQLVSLQNSLPADDSLRPKLAFVLCNLDHDCDANMQVLQSALTDTSRFKNLFADQVQDMISRLIDREDSRGNDRATTSLTRTLIAIAPQADGALSDGIGMTLSKQLRARAEVFMSAWAEHFGTMTPEESHDLKSRIFGLMRASHRLTTGEIRKIRNNLNSIREYSQAFREAARDFSELYFHPNTPLRQ